MNKIWNVIIVIVFLVTAIFSKEVLNYSLSADFIFDSNIERNLTEVNKPYILPTLDLQLISPNNVPLYLTGSIAFDHYLKERDYDDNSPFASLGLGFDKENKRIKFRSEISGQYYMGFGYEIGSEDESWKAVGRSADWDNRISYQRKRKKYSLRVVGGIEDYAKEVDSIKNDKSGYKLDVIPSFIYKIKKKKDKAIRLKSVGLNFSYEYFDAFSREDDFQRFSIPLEFKLKFFRADIDNEIELCKKTFMNSRVEDITKQNIKPYYNRISFGTDISIPIIADFKIVAGGKLRFRDSNWSSFDYNRHTCHLLLQWKQKVER